MTLPAHVRYGAARSGAKRRHAEQRRRDAAQAQVLEATERAYKAFARRMTTTLALFAQARLLGRLQALRIVASELDWVDLTVEISALLTRLLRTLQGQRSEDDEAKVARRTRPRITRPQVHAGVEPHTPASF
ncbi:hypothetical protein GCM10008955_34940 [Deinococcus malanensis]|uniref:Uncharacterized protein n=1 Tax=Deinococcus malanensis TaxID=1706855 RepID=A0ABQ2F3V4_9DEIO|nr:hypothetical protein [Deinococcus malanensis]GGK38044.1 hypothetical protein GCM10008955_34940 [Deinococcus malanensis]